MNGCEGRVPVSSSDREKTRFGMFCSAFFPASITRLCNYVIALWASFFPSQIFVINYVITRVYLNIKT